MKNLLLSICALCLFALPAQAESFKYADIELPKGYTVEEGPIFEGENTHAMFFTDAEENVVLAVLFEEATESLEELSKGLVDEINATGATGKVDKNGNTYRITDGGDLVIADFSKFGNYMVVAAYSNGTNPELDGIVSSLFKGVEKKLGEAK